MRIYAVFGDNAVMIEYSYEHARYFFVAFCE